MKDGSRRVQERRVSIRAIKWPFMGGKWLENRPFGLKTCLCLKIGQSERREVAQTRLFRR